MAKEWRLRHRDSGANPIRTHPNSHLYSRIRCRGRSHRHAVGHSSSSGPNSDISYSANAGAYTRTDAAPFHSVAGGHSHSISVTYADTRPDSHSRSYCDSAPGAHLNPNACAVSHSDRRKSANRQSQHHGAGQRQ